MNTMPAKVPRDMDERLNVQELAEEIGVHRNYVGDMRAAGFLMPAGRATKREALTWLYDHPEFRRRVAAKVRFARRTGGNAQDDTDARSQ